MAMKILVIDVGGTHVKVLATGQSEPRRFDSGRGLTAAEMVAGVKSAVSDWEYDAASIGYPGIVLFNRPVAEPHNLGLGWVGFDYAKALGVPVKCINDAAMQALGDYRGDRMLFLGLGTGLGTAMIVNGEIIPMELGHARYRKRTYEDYVGQDGLERMGKKRWREEVVKVVAELARALGPTDIVIGGGNVRLLDTMPPGCRHGDNAHAFIGGFRLWQNSREANGGAPVELPQGSAEPGPAPKEKGAGRKVARRASTRKRKAPSSPPKAAKRARARKR
jgi:polyphosphate glucokinase